MRKQVLDTLSREEIQRMEDAADTERDKLIVRLLGDTGMRLGELLAVRPQDLRVEGGKNVIKVRGKGDKDRLVPIAPALARRLKRFADRSRRDSSRDHLFLTLRRGRASGQLDPVTESAVEQVIRALGQVAGIQKRSIRIYSGTRLQQTTYDVNRRTEMAEHPNAQLVRRGYEAFQRGDLDALRTDYFTPDIKWHVPGRNQIAVDFEGVDAVLHLFRRLGELTGGSYRVELHDVLARPLSGR